MRFYAKKLEFFVLFKILRIYSRLCVLTKWGRERLSNFAKVSAHSIVNKSLALFLDLFYSIFYAIKINKKLGWECVIVKMKTSLDSGQFEQREKWEMIDILQKLRKNSDRHSKQWRIRNRPQNEKFSFLGSQPSLVSYLSGLGAR